MGHVTDGVFVCFGAQDNTSIVVRFKDQISMVLVILPNHRSICAPAYGTHQLKEAGARLTHTTVATRNEGVRLWRDLAHNAKLLSCQFCLVASAGLQDWELQLDGRIPFAFAP